MLDARGIAEAARNLHGDSEVSESTVHYYTQVGILPPALNRGRNGFTPEHLARFRLARLLKLEGKNLAAVRSAVTKLDRGQVQSELDRRAQRALPAPTLYPRATSRALTLSDYVEGPRPGFVEAGGPRPTPPRAGPAPAAPPPVNPMVSAAVEAASGGLPRSLRFSGGFALQCPPDAPDELVARLYSTIEDLLERERSSTE